MSLAAPVRIQGADLFFSVQYISGVYLLDEGT